MRGMLSLLEVNAKQFYVGNEGIHKRLILDRRHPISQTKIQDYHVNTFNFCKKNKTIQLKCKPLGMSLKKNKQQKTWEKVVNWCLNDSPWKNNDIKSCLLIIDDTKYENEICKVKTCFFFCCECASAISQYSQLKSNKQITRAVYVWKNENGLILCFASSINVTLCNGELSLTQQIRTQTTKKKTINKT